MRCSGWQRISPQACLCLSGLKGSLQRMQLEYVDVVFANRPDSNTPMEGEFCGLDPRNTNIHVENICNVDSGIHVPLRRHSVWHGVPVAGATGGGNRWDLGSPPPLSCSKVWSDLLHLLSFWWLFGYKITWIWVVINNHLFIYLLTYFNLCSKVGKAQPTPLVSRSFAGGTYSYTQFIINNFVPN